MTMSLIWLGTTLKVQFFVYYTETASLLFHQLAGHSVKVDKQTWENQSDHFSESSIAKHLWM